MVWRGRAGRALGSETVATAARRLETRHPQGSIAQARIQVLGRRGLAELGRRAGGGMLALPLALAGRQASK